MHGLVNRALQMFIRETHGGLAWAEIARATGAGVEGFEAMQVYDDRITETLLDTAAQELGRSRDSILEDMGTWLVSSPSGQSLRRLLRFGGVDFTDFLYSLEELPGRARLALPALALPDLELAELRPDLYRLTCCGVPGFGHVLVGILRAMADDYGALVLMEHATGLAGAETITINLLAADFSEGKRFDLAIGGG